MLENVKTEETLLQLSMRAYEAGDYEHAIDLNKKFLRNEPSHAKAWANLGVYLRKIDHLEAAVAAYLKSIHLDQDSAYVWSSLGNVYTDLYKFDKAIAAHQQAINLKATHSAWSNLAVTCREACEFEQALACLEQAQALAPQSEQAKYDWERSYILLYLQQPLKAWPLFEKRFLAGKLNDYSLPMKKWQGESLEGLHLLVIEEQGYGDTLLMSRFLPQLIKLADQVTLVCKPELHGLFSGLDITLCDKASLQKHWSADYYVSMMSLMHIFQVDLINVPEPVPMVVNRASVNKYQWIAERYCYTYKVGIVWSGSTTFAGNKQRALHFNDFLPLLHLPDIQLFSFQKGPREKELAEHALSPVVVELGSGFTNFSDTAAALQQMDCIVMTDSSVAHLAASLGVPVINMLQYKPYWLYGVDGDITPWYSSMTLLRQRKPGQWGYVLDQAVEKMKQLSMDEQQNAGQLKGREVMVGNL